MTEVWRSFTSTFLLCWTILERRSQVQAGQADHHFLLTFSRVWRKRSSRFAARIVLCHFGKNRHLHRHRSCLTRNAHGLTAFFFHLRTALYPFFILRTGGYRASRNMAFSLAVLPNRAPLQVTSPTNPSRSAVWRLYHSRIYHHTFQPLQRNLWRCTHTRKSQVETRKHYMKSYSERENAFSLSTE